MKINISVNFINNKTIILLITIKLWNKLLLRTIVTTLHILHPLNLIIYEVGTIIISVF